MKERGRGVYIKQTAASTPLACSHLKVSRAHFLPLLRPRLGSLLVPLVAQPHQLGARLKHHLTDESGGDSGVVGATSGDLSHKTKGNTRVPTTRISLEVCTNCGENKKGHALARTKESKYKQE